MNCVCVCACVFFMFSLVSLTIETFVSMSNFFLQGHQGSIKESVAGSLGCAQGNQNDP